MKLTTTTEPKIMQAILATKFNDFEIGADRRNQFGALLGDSIFNQDGAAWAHSRALFRPQFSRENINNLESTEKAARTLIDVLPTGSNGWTAEFDMVPYFYRFTLDTATGFLFGHNVESQRKMAYKQSSNPAASADILGNEGEFAEAFATSQEWLSNRIKLQGLYWLCDTPRYRRAVETVRTFVTRVIQRTLDNRIGASKTGDDGEKYNLLDSLTESTQDPVLLRDQLVGKLKT
jgi:cytochrome P450